MSNYKEDQEGELEALESIYPEELEFITRQPLAEFTITIKSEKFDEENPEHGAIVTVKFAYTPNYPDEAPEITVESLEGSVTGDDEQTTLQEYLIEQASENLGMVMIFTLTSAALDWLNHRCDSVTLEKEQVAERRQKLREEEEQKRFEGTCVTVETFMKWKIAFEEEFLCKKRAKKEEIASRRLTGKEMFLQDKSMNESDLKFLEEGAGEGVKVDESLFENLDELDLDDLDESEDV